MFDFAFIFGFLIASLLHFPLFALGSLSSLSNSSDVELEGDGGVVGRLIRFNGLRWETRRLDCNAANAGQRGGEGANSGCFNGAGVFTVSRMIRFCAV